MASAKTYRSYIFSVSHGIFMLVSFFSFFVILQGISFSEELPVCSGCHKKQSEGLLHPVIKTGGCIACHTKPHSSKAKKTKFLPATGVELCWRCHDKAKFGKKFKHAPVAGDQCMTCHNVHGSEYEKLLTMKMPDLCFTCHDKTKFENKDVHAPVAGGMCTSCHDPHSSDTAKLLVRESPDLCYTCHDKKQFSSKKVIHPPVAGGMCTSCHAPHASPQNKLLVKKTPGLCFDCHNKKKFTGRKKKAKGKKAVYVHKPVRTGECAGCHAPHQADSDKLLLLSTPELCYQCHDKAKYAGKKYVHAPVAAGQCAMCHKPHASRGKHLLPRIVNTVCVKCHADVLKKPHIAKGHPVLTRAFKLRGGKRFRLSCISCHNPHTSDSPKLFKFNVESGEGLCKRCHRRK